MIIRKAEEKDLQTVADIYEEIHTAEENGNVTIGWIRGVYPTIDTAREAYECGELFVQEDDGRIVGAGRINQVQVDVYADGAWEYEALDEEIMVFHTLVISPSVSGKGYGTAFVDFYEKYALDNGCRYLRIDTNERNVKARKLYKKLGYREADIKPCVFNGIEGVQLVLLEKKL